MTENLDLYYQKVKEHTYNLIANVTLESDFHIKYSNAVTSGHV